MKSIAGPETQPLVLSSTLMSEPETSSPPPAALPPLRRRPANAVPRLPEWKERLIRVIAVVTLAYWTYYIAWRWGWTLNTKHLWFSLPLVLAETWGWLTAFVMVHSVWRIKHRQPLEAPPGMSVDVFITCYDEPLEVIRRTAIGARAIRYPHATWVLDDGGRDEVKAMADELGLGYLRRTTHEHAKAGNLNHALKHTSGDFILQLDADHVPLPHILDRVLGFFAEDPRLGFVQTPQDFYNTDAFTYNVDENSRRIWEEQRLFFGVIQPGKDSINGTFFCGCSAVIRRAALDEIGGFSTQTITEDIETSLLLHANGWNSAFYGESLVYGLAAHSAVAFHTQHLRWGQGGMQVLKRLNPLTYPGLSLSQRISYFGSLTAYVGGVQKLIFYASPLVFFVTGVLPINAINREFLARFLPFLFLSFLLSEAVSRGRSNTWIAERYHMVKFWTYTRAVASFFSRKEQKFKVTPKGPGHVPFKTYAPQVVLMAATAGAMLWATLTHELGWVRYSVEGWKSAAFVTNGIWAAINFAVALSVVRLSLRVRQQRLDHRFRDRFPVSVRLHGQGGKTGRAHVALAEDLNPSGMSFRTSRALPDGAELRLTLPLSTATVEVKARVLHSRLMEEKKRRKSGKAGLPGGGVRVPTYRVGVLFEELPMNVRDLVELHCTQHAVPMEQQQYRIDMVPNVFERPMEMLRNTRRERREEVRMAARVTLGERGGQKGSARECVAFLEEVSASGARLVMDKTAVPGTPVRFDVPGTAIRGKGRVVFSRAIETPVGVRFAVGVRRHRDPGVHDKTETRKEKRMTARTEERLKRAGAVVALLAALAGAQPAAAQINTVVYGATEFDAEDLQLYLLGVGVSTPGLGFQLSAGISAFHLVFPSGVDQTQTLNAVTPQAGVRYQTPAYAVQAHVGYQFTDADDEDGTGPDGVIGAPTGGSDGVVTNLQGNHWGDGTTNLQAIASYNWGAEYLWTNARASRRVMSLGGEGNGINLGLEAGFQSDLGADEGYRAWQAGPLVEWQVSRAFRLVGVVGAKGTNVEIQDDVFPYVKLEFVAFPNLFGGGM